MKLEMILNVTSEELYNFFVENLKKELNIKGNLKKGMKYNKVLNTKLNVKANTTVEIYSLIPNKEYGLKYISSIGYNYLIYNIFKIDDDKVKLIVEEKYYTDSFFRRYNQIITEIFFSFFIKRRRKKIFKEIEEYIISNRRKGDKL